MSANDPDAAKPYRRLHESLDAAIGSFGTELVTRYLELLHVQGNGGLDASLREVLITAFLKSEVVRVFELIPQKLFSDDGEDYILARKACFHLLNRHTGASFSEIGRLFGRSKQVVHYHVQDCEKALEQQRNLRNYSSRFLSRYAVLQDRLLVFLQKLI